MAGGGKIVSIVGTIRSGKSYLTNKLAKHYGVPGFLEGEEDEIPAEIIEGVAKNVHHLRRFIFFRNLFVKQHREALELAKRNRFVFLDTGWMSCIPYIEQIPEGLERSLAKEMAALDSKMLPWPDLVVHLQASEETVRRFQRAGGRRWDSSDSYLKRQYSDMRPLLDEYFAQTRVPVPIFEIDRTALDFDVPSNFAMVTERIEAL